MLYRVQSANGLAEVAQRLEAAGLKYKFGVLAVHDLKAKMKEKGVDFERDCLIYEVCNPQQAKRVLEANAEVSTALPCRISMYREGGGVTLAMLRPTALLDLFQIPGLHAIAEEVEEVMVKMMNEAAG
jgi:uncharacterized protein (DUF302 family)